MQGSPYFTVKQVATTLGIDERSVRDKLTLGTLKGTKRTVGNKDQWFVHQRDLDAEVARRGMNPASQGRGNISPVPPSQIQEPQQQQYSGAEQASYIEVSSEFVRPPNSTAVGQIQQYQPQISGPTQPAHIPLEASSEFAESASATGTAQIQQTHQQQISGPTQPPYIPPEVSSEFGRPASAPAQIQQPYQQQISGPTQPPYIPPEVSSEFGRPASAPAQIQQQPYQQQISGPTQPPYIPPEVSSEFAGVGTSQTSQGHQVDRGFGLPFQTQQPAAQAQMFAESQVSRTPLEVQYLPPEPTPGPPEARQLPPEAAREFDCAPDSEYGKTFFQRLNEITAPEVNAPPDADKTGSGSEQSFQAIDEIPEGMKKVFQATANIFMKPLLERIEVLTAADKDKNALLQAKDQEIVEIRNQLKLLPDLEAQKAKLLKEIESERKAAEIQFARAREQEEEARALAEENERLKQKAEEAVLSAEKLQELEKVVQELQRPKPGFWQKLFGA